MYRKNTAEDSRVLLKSSVAADATSPDSQESHREILKHYMTSQFDNITAVDICMEYM